MGSRLPDAEKQGGGEGKLADPFPMDSVLENLTKD